MSGVAFARWGGCEPKPLVPRLSLGPAGADEEPLHRWGLALELWTGVAAKV